MTIQNIVELSQAAADKTKSPKSKGADLVIHDGAPMVLTESNLANAFALQFAGKLRFNHTSGKWHVWTGTHWQPDETRQAFDWVRQFTEGLNTDGKAKWARAAVFAAVERIAESDRLFACTESDFNRDPWLLGTPGGTVDLRTGTLRPADPADMISRITGCAPAAMGTRALLWDAFVEQATNGDAGLIRFLQQSCGYALTGVTVEHILLFIFGPGGNGKGVFIDSIAGVFGDYAQAAAMETFTASKHGRHSTELAHLRGARLVTASETESGHAWAEARIKMLTGGDKVRARFLFKEEFEYLPQFQLIVVGNNKPRIWSVDDAMRRRLNLIEFKHHPATPNPMLRADLQAEHSKILRWCIDGCLDWQKNGLQRPPCVVSATAEYFAEQDLVSQWIVERCELRDGFRTSASQLFKDWSEWARAAGEDPGTQTEFGESLNRLGIYRKKTAKQIVRLGIRLAAASTPDPRDSGECD